MCVVLHLFPLFHFLFLFFALELHSCPSQPTCVLDCLEDYNICWWINQLPFLRQTLEKEP